MPYGTIKVDNITFTNGGSDSTITVSGIVESISGNITATGTIQGATIIGTSTVSGATVTGSTASFTSGTFVSGIFTTQISGATITGNTGNFTTFNAGTANLTSGVFASGTEGAPSLSIGTTTNGLYSPGADQVAISTGGSGRLFVDASGNVGVGTDSLSRNFTVRSASTIVAASLVSNPANIAYLLFGDTDADAQGRVQYNNSTDSLELYSAGSERLRITSAGLVGVGTSTPDIFSRSHAQILGISSASGSSFIQINGATGDLGGIEIGAGAVRYGTLSAAAASVELGTNAAIPLFLGTNNVIRVAVDSSGNVGIGTTAVSSRLHVLNLSGGSSTAEVSTVERDNSGYFLKLYRNAGSGNTGGLIGADSAGTYYTGGHNTQNMIYIDAGNGVMQFYTNNDERARIDSSGRLLVGTSSARTNFYNSSFSAGLQLEGTGTNRRLSVTGADEGGAVILARQNSGAVQGNTIVANNNGVGYISFQGSDGSEFVEAASIVAQVDGDPGANDMPGRLVFSVTPDGGSSPTTSPSAMTINSGQEVLIGYSTDNGAYKLQVNSQIFATSATIATSDGRYKENVVTLDGCVDLVKALRPVSFDWKAQQPITRVDEDGETVVVREAHNFPDGKQVGFIAQEVEKVLADKPWLGSVIKQNVRPAVTDNDGNELAPEEEFLGIAEGNLVAVLTSALKDAIGRIESLEAEVAAIKT